MKTTENVIHNEYYINQANETDTELTDIKTS